MNSKQGQVHIVKSSSLDSLQKLQPNSPSETTPEDNPELNSNAMEDRNRRKSIIPKSHLPLSNEPCSILQATAKKMTQPPDLFHSSIQTYPTDNSSNFPLEQHQENVHSDPIFEQDREPTDSFDAFVISNFVTFSGSQDVIRWLDDTEKKFNQYKFSRNLRFDAIPLLLEGEAKRKYIRNRKDIQSFDDFYEFILNTFEKTVSFSSTTTQSTRNHNSLGSGSMLQSKQEEDTSKSLTNTFDNSGFSPQPPILRSKALGDLSITVNSTKKPSSTVSMTNATETTTLLDHTTNDLRKAILESFVKTPKTFQGAKEDVIKWLEELEHLFDIAHIPDINKLDLISYSLRGDALQWYKNSKTSFSTWKDFSKEIKKAFTSSYQQELSFKKLETYIQTAQQSIRNYYNEVLKLCNEADPTMTEATKLKHLLSKAKPSIQFEVRRNKPTSPTEFLNYAKEAEGLYQLSNMHFDSDTTGESSHSNTFSDQSERYRAPPNNNNNNNSTSNASQHRSTQHVQSSYSSPGSYPQGNAPSRSHGQFSDRSTYRQTFNRYPSNQNSRFSTSRYPPSSRSDQSPRSYTSNQQGNQSQHRQNQYAQPQQKTTANINQPFSDDSLPAMADPSMNPQQEALTDFQDHTSPPHHF
jgi:hypothetical protein